MTKADFVRLMLDRIVSKIATEYVMGMRKKKSGQATSMMRLTGAGTWGHAGINGREVGGMTSATFVKTCLARLSPKQLQYT